MIYTTAQNVHNKKLNFLNKNFMNLYIPRYNYHLIYCLKTI